MSQSDYLMSGWIGPVIPIQNIPQNSPPIDLIPNTVFLSQGISLNTNTGVFNLVPNKTYRITVRLSGTYTQINSFKTSYGLVDLNNTLLYPNSEAMITSHTAGCASILDMLYHTGQNHYFKIRIFDSNGSMYLDSKKCSIIIEEI